jgi:polygalacturonase
MRRLINRNVVVLLLLGLLSLSQPGRTAPQARTLQRKDADRERRVDWTAVPAILARIKPPQFPARDFKITDYGATPGGTNDSTEAISKAIAACHAAGGGRVVVPPGLFLTGAIHLQSNVNLYLAEGATLKFSPDPAKYLPVVYTRFEGTECMNYSPLIYAFEQANIAIIGKGTLDGSASDQNWWAWNRKGANGADAPARASIRRLIDFGERGVPVKDRIFGQGYYLRPNFIQPYRSRNVLIEGIRIINSPMWEINPVLSTNVTVRGVRINSHGPNNDGCDPESSREVLIEDCTFDTGDDCIAIKSGRDADGALCRVWQHGAGRKPARARGVGAAVDWSRSQSDHGCACARWRRRLAAQTLISRIANYRR